MTLQLGGGSGPVAAPRLKPVTLTSALAPYQASNTVGAAAAQNGYAGIAAAFPSFVGTAAPAAAAPTGGGLGGLADTSALSGGSDYSAQIAALVAPTAESVRAGDVTNMANLSAQRRQAIAQFGYVPSNLSGQLTGDVNADINDETRGLAAASTAGGLSTYAQLQKAYHDQQASDWASLASRGMVHSGAAGQHMNADLLAYQQGYEQSAQKLVDYLQQAYQSYLGLKAQGQSQLAEATNQALQRIIAQIQANQYAAAQAAQQATSDGGGGGGGGGEPAQISVAGGPVAALSQPGAVGAMGGPANWANAMQTVTKPKAAARPYQPLVGRDF